MTAEKVFMEKQKSSRETEKNYCKVYNTIVCKIDKDGNFVKLWDGYSYTTLRHINSFILHFGIAGGGKSWWENLRYGRN